MARTFTQNIANYCDLNVGTLGALVNGVSSLTVAAWVKPATLTAGTNVNRILCLIVNSNSSGLVLMISGSPVKVELGARSQSGDAFGKATGATTVSTGSWVHVAGTVNYSSPNITVYLNGTSDGTATPTFGASTLTIGTPTAPDMIGAFSSVYPVTTNAGFQFDGDIAEVGLWDTALSAAEIAALAKGVPPSRVRSRRLCAYYPLQTDGTTVPNRVGSTALGTVTGSIPIAAHAPVSPWFGESIDWPPYAVSAAPSTTTYFFWHGYAEESLDVLTY